MTESSSADSGGEVAPVTTGRKQGSRPKGDAPPLPQIPQRAPLPSPINWWKLDDEERAETLEVLGQWVPELVRRYRLRDPVVPPCWFLHEALVQELLALFQYRNQQQVQPTAPPSAMLDFHSQFDLAIRRLTNWTTSTRCNSAEHRDTTLSMWVVPDSVQASTWAVDLEGYVKTIRSGNAGVKA